VFPLRLVLQRVAEPNASLAEGAMLPRLNPRRPAAAAPIGSLHRCGGVGLEHPEELGGQIQEKSFQQLASGEFGGTLFSELSQTTPPKEPFSLPPPPAMCRGSFFLSVLQPPIFPVPTRTVRGGSIGFTREAIRSLPLRSAGRESPKSSRFGLGPHTGILGLNPGLPECSAPPAFRILTPDLGAPSRSDVTHPPR